MIPMGPIDVVTARGKVERFLATRPLLSKSDRWAITKIEEYDCFWLFVWNSAHLIERRQATGWTPRITGNNPIAVRKDDGSMYVWSVLCTLDELADCMRRKDYSRHACPLEQCFPEYKDGP